MTSGNTQFRLNLLGEFRLTREAVNVVEIRARRRQLVLAYLALNRGLIIDRAHFAALLWPDSTEQQARTNLRHLLHAMRRTLPDFPLLITDTGAALTWREDADCIVDVSDFLDGLCRADAAEKGGDSGTALIEIQRAIALYAGELLSGYHDEWIMLERDRLEQAFLAAIERVTQMLASRRQYPAAVEYCRQLLRADPLRESGYRMLMRLHALRGDRAEIVQSYQECRDTLLAEINIEPAMETQDLFQTLMAGAASFPPRDEEAAQHSFPFVGRERQWARLEQQWKDAGEGNSQVVLLSGEAGIGKTRLAEEFIQSLSRQGATTLGARCYSAEGALSFAPVVAWLREAPVQATLANLDEPWLAEVERLLPEVRVQWPDLPKPSPIAADWHRQRLFEALARAILSARQPIALLIDDLQWCDRDTLEWMRFLLRFQPDSRLLLIATLRPEELATDHPLLPFVVSLQRDRQITEVAVEPLGEVEITRIMANFTGGDVTDEDAKRLYRETEGNPLYAVEIMRAGIDVESERHMLSPTIRAVISGRLGLLSRPALEVVRLAAAIGREFDIAQLTAVSATTEDELADALDELSQRRIVREHGSGNYDFTHDKLREVAYNQIGAMRRRVLHRRIARSIEQDPHTNLDVAAGLVAHHLERAGRVAQARTYYLRAAGHARRTYANHEAIRLYRRGLSLASAGSHASLHIRDLLEGLGDMLLLTGAHADARDAFEQAIECCPPECSELARLRHKLGNGWKVGGLFAEALACYAGAENVLGGASSNVELWIELQMDRMRVFYGQADWQAMQAIANVVGPEIEISGTARQQIEFVRIRSNAEFRRDRYVVTDQAVQRIRKSVMLARQTGDLAALADAHLSLGFATLWHGDPDGSRQELLDGLELARRIGHTELQLNCLSYLTIASRMIGQVENAEWYARQALPLATGSDMLAHVVTANANLAWIAWKRGDLCTSEELASTAVDIWQYYRVYPFQWLALWPLIDIMLARDDVVSAVSYARLLLDEMQQRLPTELEARIVAALAGDNPRIALAQAVNLARKLRYL